MIKNNIIYLVIGFILAITLLLVISASNDLSINSQKGRYEHYVHQGLLSILDSHTGIVKCYEIKEKNAKFMYEVDYNK